MKETHLIYPSALLIAIFFSSHRTLPDVETVKRQVKTEQINNLLDKVQSGDIIFRLGHGFISESMRKFSLKDSRYSHAGIIGIENGKQVVYHLLGGESSVSVIQKESLDEFCSRNEAVSFAVYRTALSEVKKKSIDSLNQYYFRIKLPYDSRFDLATDSAMYCTEYVSKILSKVSGKNILISSSMLSEHEYIACDDIYLNPFMHKVFSLDYE